MVSKSVHVFNGGGDCGEDERSVLGPEEVNLGIKKWKCILTANLWRPFGYHLTFFRNVSYAPTEVVISLVVSVWNV